MNSNENDVVDEEMDIDMSSAPTSLEIQSDMPDDLKNAINFYIRLEILDFWNQMVMLIL